MFRFLTILILLAVSVPAWAADREYDLGFVRPGMMQGQFRFGAWPPGMAVYCSDDPDRPKELARLLAMPQAMQALGATRCALLEVDDKGVWSPAKRKVAGQPTQMSATFGPGHGNTNRLVQLFMEFPRPGFAAMSKYLVSRFGPPDEQMDNLLRWRNPSQEAVLLHEDGESASIILMDVKLQAAMDARMQERYGRK